MGCKSDSELVVDCTPHVAVSSLSKLLSCPSVMRGS